jgi:hypothetical protein
MRNKEFPTRTHLGRGAIAAEIDHPDVHPRVWKLAEKALKYHGNKVALDQDEDAFTCGANTRCKSISRLASH